MAGANVVIIGSTPRVPLHALRRGSPLGGPDRLRRRAA